MLGTLVSRAVGWLGPKVAVFLGATISLLAALGVARRAGRADAEQAGRQRLLDAALARSTAEAGLAGRDDREIDRWLRDPSRR